MDITITQRAMSGFPLSIGTALAFESVFQPRQPVYDETRKIPNHVVLADYDECYINITTLYRNLIQAIEKEIIDRVTVKQIAATLTEEMSVINSLFEVEGLNMVRPIYYHSSYSRTKLINVPGFRLREPKSENKKKYERMLDETIKILNKESEALVHYMDLISPKDKVRALIMTHIPYDLLARPKFKNMDLLESNTGVLKKYSQWSSKYYPMSGESFIHLPFLRKLLYVFGDKHHIQPMPMTLRKSVLEISKKYNWTATTTKERVSTTLRLGILDPFAAKVLSSL